jgi:hypothetical protein
MATLSARGRSELLRIEETRISVTGTRVRTQRAYLSDGRVLSRNTFLKLDGHVDFDDGWKDLGKWTKAGERDGYRLAQIRDRRIREGWQEVGAAS